MIYLDESGDDGSYVKTNSKFFVICIIISDINYDTLSEYNSIVKFLNIKNKTLKWNNLNKMEREKFVEYLSSKKLEYSVYAYWVDKNKITDFKNLYKNMVTKILIKINTFETIKYKGLHLKNMFEKIRRDFKKKGLNLIFLENYKDSHYGISIADLFAGYINYSKKNNIDIISSIDLNEYIE